MARSPTRASRYLPVAILASGLVLSACGAAGDKELTEAQPRAEPSAAAVEPATVALNTFSLDLQRALAERDGNLVVASYPVALSLAMADVGAYGDTERELQAVLHANDLRVTVDDAMNTTELLLGNRSGERRSADRQGTVDLDLVASLWVQDETPLERSFLAELSRSYGTGARVVDFRSDAEAARSALNRWMDDATGGGLGELADRGTITDGTRFVLASGGYVRAPWAVPFQPSRITFHADGGNDVVVDALEARERSAYWVAQNDEWTALDVPYLGSELSLLVVMPAGDVRGFVTAFDAATYDQILDTLQPTPVEVTLPTFHFTSRLRLKRELAGLGAALAFDPLAADFGGMAADENLSISDVVTQSYLSVDEQGSDGQAATVVRNTPGAAFSAAKVTIDRPFVFFVRDRPTGLILELGRVIDPTE